VLDAIRRQGIQIKQKTVFKVIRVWGLWQRNLILWCCHHLKAAKLEKDGAMKWRK